MTEDSMLLRKRHDGVRGISVVEPLRLLGRFVGLFRLSFKGHGIEEIIPERMDNRL